MPCALRRRRRSARRSSPRLKSSIVSAAWRSWSCTPEPSETPIRTMMTSKGWMSRATGSSVAILVDSSLWVHQLRQSGDPSRRDRVNALLESGEAAWCPAIRLELWRGVTNDAEPRTLRQYEALLPDYAITPEVWE